MDSCLVEREREMKTMNANTAPVGHTTGKKWRSAEVSFQVKGMSEQVACFEKLSSSMNENGKECETERSNRTTNEDEKSEKRVGLRMRVELDLGGIRIQKRGGGGGGNDASLQLHSAMFHSARVQGLLR